MILLAVLVSCRLYVFFKINTFLVKSVLKICFKFTGEHPCRRVVSITLLCKFIEITLRHGCSPVNLLYIFRTPIRTPLEGYFYTSIPSIPSMLWYCY